VQEGEYRVFQKLLGMVPHLEERLMGCSNGESMTIADLCQVGRHQEYERRSAGLDNSPGCPTEPSNVKTNRGFHHNATGVLLCPVGVDWSDPEVRTRLADLVQNALQNRIT